MIIMSLQHVGDLPPGIIELAQSFFMTIAAIALGIPIIRAISRRFERGSGSIAQIPSDVTHRLDRIEQAVEAVAIEVERMAEAQRFTAKLMAEGRALPGGAGASGGDASGAAQKPPPLESSRRPDAPR
jgi:hypothetical protein